MLFMTVETSDAFFIFLFAARKVLLTITANVINKEFQPVSKSDC